MKADTCFSLFSPVERKKKRPADPEVNARLGVLCDPRAVKNGMSVSAAQENSKNNSNPPPSSCFNV